MIKLDVARQLQTTVLSQKVITEILILLSQLLLKYSKKIRWLYIILITSSFVLLLWSLIATSLFHRIFEQLINKQEVAAKNRK